MLNQSFSSIDFIPSQFKRNGIILIHIPKCAGSSLSLSLFGFRVSHRTIESFYQIDSSFTQAAFKFSAVRHPYFRFMSAYHYLKRGGISARDASVVEKNRVNFQSPEILATALQNLQFRDSILHFRPQAHFVSIPSEQRYKVYMDCILKTERLSHDLERFRGYFPQSIRKNMKSAVETRVNTSGLVSHAVDPDILKILRTVYSDDFELFGYDEFDTVETIKDLVNG